MNKESTIILFSVLADSFSAICKGIDVDDCRTEKCPFAKKDKHGDFVCIFEEKGMKAPYYWKGVGDEE